MFGERVAMNTPVQGTAADIIKIAMILVSRKLHETKCGAKLILQVHDELILESPADEVALASSILKDAMENAVNTCLLFVIVVVMNSLKEIVLLTQKRKIFVTIHVVTSITEANIQPITH